jgi:hypothetical protein
MGADPGAARAIVATACAGVPDAAGVKLIADRYVPESMDPPFAYPSDVSWVRDSTDDTWSYIVTWRILTGRGESRAAQQHLDVLVPGCTTALDADSRCSVDSGTGYDFFDVAGVEHYGAEIDVRVMP